MPIWAYKVNIKKVFKCYQIFTLLPAEATFLNKVRLNPKVLVTVFCSIDQLMFEIEIQREHILEVSSPQHQTSNEFSN